MTDLLYNLLIFPLEAILEFLYLLFSRVGHNQGFAIIGVGLAVNILTLPLYAKAEHWQQVERDTQKRLKPKADDIKAVFHGDERTMILSTYYRQNAYHPIYALRSSFGLLLQVPFFIAAYAFIANLPGLKGQPFFFIRDLSAQDALLAIGSLRINVLPLLMTLLNVAAAAVYTRGFPLKDKVQLYAMAAIFLALLYTSPSALLVYWTFNNLFSLVKNLVYKAKRPLAVFYACCAALALGAACAALFVLDTTPRKRLLVCALSSLVLLSPLFVRFGKLLLERSLRPALSNAKEGAALFFLSCAALTLLSGLVIPMSLVSSSTQEFSFVGSQTSPFSFILHCLGQSAGLFLFWPSVLYFLFGGKARSALAALMPLALAWALLDVFAFGGDYGTISRQLIFANPGLLKASALQNGLNLLALAAAASCLFLVVSGRKAAWGRSALLICLLALGMLSGYKASAIGRDYAAFRKARSAAASTAPAGGELSPVYHLSRSGKNVIVIMMDRAISAFMPAIMKEDPELSERFRGFVLYPNTASYNGHTLAGAPPLFGGYDYTPEEMNRRKDQSLVSKHNEALCVMPRLFAEAGWASTVSDASWANYSWVPDNSVFSRYPGITAFNLEGRYTQRWLVEHGMETDPSAKISRNLVRFSLFKILPPALRNGLYDNGKWWDSHYQPDNYADFIDKYSTLEYLPRLVAFDSGKDSFILMVNNTTHESVPLEYPGYVPTRTANDFDPQARFKDRETWNTYEVNMAAFRLLGRFLDELRANGAYDNTKIVIVSDHGYGLDIQAFSGFKDKARVVPYYNPLLMAKDFSADAAFSEDRRFGTNADTPALATSILGKVVNPFTGRPLRSLAPGETVRVVDKSILDPSAQGRNTMSFDERDIVEVKNDIFVESNWSFAK